MLKSRSTVFATLFLISCSVLAQSGQSLPDAPGAQAPQQNGQPNNKPNNEPSGQQPAGPHPTGPTVIMDTSMGRITCGLFDKQAPIAVSNFVGLATGTKEWTDPVTHQKVQGKPFYDGTTFHRVIPGFMIQGGDRLGTGMGDAGYAFRDEFDPDLNFDVAGRLAMANSGPDTNGSQFFITEAPEHYLDQKYTIFGQCNEHSVIVVQSIAMVNRDQNDKPLEPVVLKKVTVIPAGQPVPGPAADGAGAAAPQQP